MEFLPDPVWLSQPSGAAEVVGPLVLALAIPLIVGMYLLPTLVAVKRAVPDRGSVAVINVLLGWSFIGWVVALALAFRSRAARPGPTPSDNPASASPPGEVGSVPAPTSEREDSESPGGATP